MKKLISFFTVALFLCFSINTFAQVTIPAANTNTNGDRHPYGFFFGYERTAIIYTQAEIGQYGNITKIGFYLNSQTLLPATLPIVIKMNTTTASALLTSQTYAATSTGATTVFTGNLTAANYVVDTWVEVTLDTPFPYSTDNLLVLVESNYGGAGISGGTSTNVLFRRSAPIPAANRMTVWNADNAPPTGTASPTTTRSNVQLTFAPAVNCAMSIQNLNPTGTIFPGCGTTYAPKVKITNNGSDAQTNISVNYAVGIYNQTVSGLSLAAGANMDVDFPNTLSYTAFDAGVKNVTVTVDATCNGPVQYVLNTNFTVSPLNPNFGGPVDNYYFANSTPGASCAPDQPFVEWEDTTGSTSLILDGANQVGALLVGDVDDGFFALGDPIDGVQRYFRYQGVDYDSFFVGTNGMIAFSRANNTQAQLTTFTPLAIPGTAAPRPAIFPFWKDFNYTDIDVPVNRLSYKTTADKFIITYDRAPNFNTAADPNDYASFQVVLEISTAPTLDGWIQVNYNEPGTGASFLTKYFGLTLAAHTVGQQDVSGTSAIQYRRAVTSTVTNSGPLFSSSVSVAYGPDQNALPVELASFTASTNGNNVDLNWSTTTETNNSGFDIERSSVNGSWTKIGNVTGNGTTASAQNYTYRDRNVTSGNYNYRLKQIDFNGNFAYYNLSNEVNVGIPTQYALSQNYPNPFNPSTSINYEIPFDGKVSLKIFDMTGKEVMTLVNEVKTAGYYTYNFNASNLSSGVYFYSISANNFTATKKMMLLK